MASDPEAHLDHGGHGSHDDGLEGVATHRHPHPPDDPSGLPRIGIIGAGQAGTGLGVAFGRAGWPVVAVASRSAERRERFVGWVPGARSVEAPQQLIDDVDLVFVTVPDDAIVEVASAIRLYAGQSIVHTSGALPASVLDPARAAGSMAASFHPLVAFADVERSVSALHGATVALEGDESLVELLGRLAGDVGADAVRLPPGGKPAYHAAAVLAAGGFIGLLDAIAELGRGIGLDERDALAIYAPLVRQSLANAEAMGIADALTGPLLRGDIGTIRGHLEVMRRLAPGALPLYVAAAQREVDIALQRGTIGDGRAAELEALLAGASAPGA
jgi:predicted short-subunit dehydrogenase-like oxidoreductase (DUF2520 family)